MTEVSWALFHRDSPYDEFDPSPYPADIQGWHSNDSWFEEIIRDRKPRTICEIGTWKGASALHMASLCRRFDLNTKIVCVDTFLGSPEHWLNPEWYSWLRHKNGLPQLYYTFLSNVIRNRCQDCIIPLPMDAASAAVVLKHHGLKFDLIYLDGGHEYDSVLRDLRMFWPLVAEGGVLLGDDYIRWPGVTDAADQFASDNKLDIVGKVTKFVLTRGRALTLTGVSPPTPEELLEFDEDWYLGQYPDVAKAIEEGRGVSGLAHYLAWGRAEGRLAVRPKRKQ